MIDYDKVMRIGKQVLEDMYHRGYFDGQKDMPHDVAEAYNDGYADGQKDRDMDIPPSIDDAYRRGYADAEKKHQADLDYKNGLEDGRMETWECARKISNMTMDECEKIFGEYRYLATILPNVSASEAIAKVKEYEQKQTDTKEGYWIKTRGENILGLPVYECSECKGWIASGENELYRYRFCSHCGAKMVEQESEEG